MKRELMELQEEYGRAKKLTLTVIIILMGIIFVSTCYMIELENTNKALVGKLHSVKIEMLKIKVNNLGE